MAKDQERSGLNVARIMSFAVLLIIIAVIGALSFKVMRNFLLPLFMATLLVVIVRPFHLWVLHRCGQRRRTAALLTTAAILLTVLIPLVWCLTLAVKEGADLVTRDWGDTREQIEKLRGALGLVMPHSDQLELVDGEIKKLATQSGAAAVGSPVPTQQEFTDLYQHSVSFDNELKSVADSEDGSKRDRARAADAHQAMQPLLDTISQARDWVNQLHTDGHSDWDATTLARFQETAGRVEMQYRTVRHDLVGGFPWVWLMELSNPSQAQMQRWQHKAGSVLRGWLFSITGHTTALLTNLLLGMAIMVIAIYYFLIDGPAMIKTLMRLSPLDDEYEEELLEQFGSVSRAVVLATLLSALVQGILSGIGYAIVGLNALFLLTVLTMLLALVPFVGAAAIWVPAALYLAFVADQPGRAVFLAIYGLTIVSMADNIIKPYVLHGQSKLHPLLALLSVIGGVQALGPIGILVGPMVVSFLQALLNILRKEMIQIENA